MEVERVLDSWTRTSPMGQQRTPLDNTRCPPNKARRPGASKRTRLQLLQSSIRNMARRKEGNQPSGARIMAEPTKREHKRRWWNRVARERKRLERDPSLAVCWLCGGDIEMELPYTHPRAFTLDHVVPLAAGGDMYGETRPAHRECNSSRGDGRRKKDQKPTLLEW